MDYLNQAKPQFEGATEHLKTGLASLRTGRAHPSLVEDLQVEAYGVKQGLKTLASISTPDAKTIQIEPWDPSVLGAIESAIHTSELGIHPTVDGKVVRLVMPMMTDENRQRLVKQVKEKVESARVAVRQVREEVKKLIEKQEGIGEDEKRHDKERLDAKIKEMNEWIEKIGKEKEEAIMTI